MKSSAAAAHDALAAELLAVRCQLGERQAYEELIGRWNRPLWRYARNLSPNDSAAADAVQEVWLQVLRSITRLRDSASVSQKYVSLHVRPFEESNQRSRPM